MKAQEAEEPLLRQFDRWWFGYGSATSLGVFRILMGFIIFLNLLSLAIDWSSWFGERGFVPAWLGQAWLGRTQELWGMEVNRLNLLGGVTDPRMALGAFIVTTLAALMTSIGLFTRFSAYVLAILFVSLHHRNAAILHGGDTVMRIGAIYLAVSPCGRACSLDRLLRLRKGEADESETMSLWPQRLVQYNTALIYFTTVWAKSFGDKWLNGTATYFPARLAEFYRFPVPSFANDFPLVYLTTYGTLLVEFSLATLVFFRPFRKYVLLAGVALHGFIEYAMNIPLFSALMISCYVCHFDGEEISAYCKRLGERLRGKLGLEVSLPAGARLSATGARFLDAVDPLGLVAYVPGERWEARTANGGAANPFWAAAFRSPGAWIFLALPGAWRRMVVESTEVAA